jgi:hypothetical protein
MLIITVLAKSEAGRHFVSAVLEVGRLGERIEAVSRPNGSCCRRLRRDAHRDDKYFPRISLRHRWLGYGQWFFRTRLSHTSAQLLPYSVLASELQRAANRTHCDEVDYGYSEPGISTSASLRSSAHVSTRRPQPFRSRGLLSSGTTACTQRIRFMQSRSPPIWIEAFRSIPASTRLTADVGHAREQSTSGSGQPRAVLTVEFLLCTLLAEDGAPSILVIYRPSVANFLHASRQYIYPPSGRVQRHADPWQHTRIHGISLLTPKVCEYSVLRDESEYARRHNCKVESSRCACHTIEPMSSSARTPYHFHELKGGFERFLVINKL